MVRLAEQLHLNVLAESVGNRVPQRIFEHPVHQHGNIRAEVAAAVFIVAQIILERNRLTVCHENVLHRSICLLTALFLLLF